MNFTELSVNVAENDDPIAFKKIVEHFFPGLLSFANSILQNKALSEEVVEDVFIKLWENRKMLTTIRSLSYYLYIAVKNACFNCLQKQKNLRHIAFEEIGDDLCFSFSTAESDIISKENLDKISAAIHALPSKCRLIFRLIKEEGMKHKEVAQLLNISLKTVEAQMTIALRKITEQLQVHLPELVPLSRKCI